jgi:hypothetical protein
VSAQVIERKWEEAETARPAIWFSFKTGFAAISNSVFGSKVWTDQIFRNNSEYRDPSPFGFALGQDDDVKLRVAT